MNKTIVSDPEALAFLAMLPIHRRHGTQEGAGRKRLIGQRLRVMLMLYILVVAGTSAVFFLLGVLLRHW